MILLMPVLTSCHADVGVGVGVGVGSGWWGSGWSSGWYPYGGISVFFTSDVDRATLTPEEIVLINNMTNDARNNGYTVTSTNTPDKISIRAEKYIANIVQNDIDGLPSFVVKDGERFITVKNEPSKYSYNIRAIVDLTDINNDKAINLSNNSKTLRESKIDFRMNLPCSVKHTNAEKRLNNGKCLEWSLIPGRKNLISVDFEVPKTGNLY
ncbi:MAG TPA: hypothetical protein DDX14_08440 [Cyanobacteria bacterium UBA9579]|nr:hypothetical protein [Cyanobacteria bacterium UBA9579]